MHKPALFIGLLCLAAVVFYFAGETHESKKPNFNEESTPESQPIASTEAPVPENKKPYESSPPRTAPPRRHDIRDVQQPEAVQTPLRSLEEAKKLVNASAPRSWKEFLNAKTVGPVRDPRAKNDPQTFVGFVEARNVEPGMRYVSLSHEQGKWTLCGYPDEKTCWPPREALAYEQDPDVWTFYFPGGYRLFLKFVEGVEVPNHEGKKILAGWVLHQDGSRKGPVARMALINDDGADGSILTQVWPD